MPDGEIQISDLEHALEEYADDGRLSDADRREILKRLHVVDVVFNYDEYIRLMLK